MIQTNPMIEALQNPNAYPENVDYIKLMETHISWVFLTGKYAYKIKKPVNFGFIDYTTLEKRHHYCEQEILLNQPLASQLYLQVLPITQDASGYHINGPGEIVDYAVQMLEFSQENLLNHVLRRHQLTSSMVESVALQLAQFHLHAEHALPETPYGTPFTVNEPVMQNFMQARELLTEFKRATPTYLDPLKELETQSVEEYERIQTTLLDRKRDGYIRSCHGDLHLGNITLLGKKPVIFDCIEFNEYFRWTDVMGDVGFLMMDFYDHLHPGLAIQFLNTYLTYTGDYASLTVLPYYFAYRAMVRGKIQLYNIYTIEEDKKEKCYQKYLNYVILAHQYLKKRKPFIILMHGFSGSGKSSLAQSLAQQLGAIIVRSDVERKRLFDLTPDARTKSQINGNIYLPEITRQTYARLENLATSITTAFYPVIIDARFSQAEQRQIFIDLATKQQIQIFIIHCEADVNVLMQRVTEREQAAVDFSEANVKYLEHELKHHDPLTAEEQKFVITINTNIGSDTEQVYKELSARLGS